MPSESTRPDRLADRVAERLTARAAEARRYWRRRRLAIATVASGALYAGGWTLGYATAYDRASALVLVLATIAGGMHVARTAVEEVRARTLGIKTLVTLAAIGAIAIGEYWEAAAVVFLFSLGSSLEGRTMRRTRSALQGLLELSPDTARVRRNGELVEVPARDVAVGETVVVRPSDQVPVDGVVVDGESAVDQSPVTGESAPIPKASGDEVYAGTINQGGVLHVETTGAGADTTLQRIVRRVEEAQEAQAPAARFVDRFARYYTPAVVVLAVGAFLVTRDALLALTLLVVGCPGALVIGPPVSYVSAIGNAARNGVLLKGGAHLETAGSVDVIAFDKTGTLTRGEPTVVDAEGFGVEPARVLELAGIAEKYSEHHLADAIRDAARDPSLVDGLEGSVGDAEHETATDGGPLLAHDDGIPEPDAFEVVAGKGVLATHDDRDLVVGNRALLDAAGVDVPDPVAAAVREHEAAGETAVHVAVDGDVVGVLALRDELRDGAADAVAALHDAGVRTVLLTGDNERTARAVADAVGIGDVRASLLPEAKQDAIRAFQDRGDVVAMVGDGVNDAPSLATANVGIAMGAAGTDTAIETADVALMADDLARIPYAIGLSKATRRNVRENVALAVLTVLALLAAVLGDVVHLAGGMLVHEGSVLLVVLNGMRLRRY